MKILFLLILALLAFNNNYAFASESDFVMIPGGTFQMGSPTSENWRGNDETQHEVTIGDFYLSKYELTQGEYKALTGGNPSSFKGDNLPVENISWLDAINYCNLLSEREGLAKVYEIKDNEIIWHKEVDGYRLPTEAEWEYACRAGTVTPFNNEKSISASEANYYGHYPYEIEENYFTQAKLTTKPGIYRAETVKIGSFAPNKFGLYDMHGNVAEWCWDVYGEYDLNNNLNPTGPASGTRRVYRGGAWNDFAKNMRSAYRAAMPQDGKSYNLGMRLARGPIGVGLAATSAAINANAQSDSSAKILIAYFSWSGNTRDIAQKIYSKLGKSKADMIELEPVKSYSEDYSTVLKQAQHDQHIQARPELKNKIKNIAQYNTIILGYPNWWASIPMPIASFLESYDLSGKTIMPFCSHGGGRFGQSLTAIAKLAQHSAITQGLSIHYGGGSSLMRDIENWLKANKLN